MRRFVWYVLIVLIAGAMNFKTEAFFGNFNLESILTSLLAPCNPVDQPTLCCRTQAEAQAGTTLRHCYQGSSKCVAQIPAATCLPSTITPDTTIAPGAISQAQITAVLEQIQTLVRSVGTKLKEAGNESAKLIEAGTALEGATFTIPPANP